MIKTLIVSLIMVCCMGAGPLVTVVEHNVTYVPMGYTFYPVINYGYEYQPWVGYNY